MSNQKNSRKRSAKIKRKTGETDISVELNLDGQGRNSVSTSVPFLDHMLELFSKHSLIDLKVKATGDTEVDDHHTVEDIGLVLGEALDKALGDRKAIGRYGSASIPMDDALGRVAVDLGGRPYLVYRVACRKRKLGTFELGLVKEFMQSLSVQGRLNLHIEQPYGTEPHHCYESIFKALARAMRAACERDARVKGVPSSKGRL